MLNPAQNRVAAATQAVNTPGTIAGSAGGGAMSAQKDATTSSTEPKFGEIYKQIQAKYGEKTEKPREIKKTLGKDDFLRIMITQMRHQDPTSPFKPDQMAAQMAQFASVEQLSNMNQSLQKMSSQNNPLEKLAMTNMIGKVVTVDRERFSHTEGQSESLAFVLPADAAEVKAEVVSENGETVFSKDLGPTKAGESSFAWDGAKMNTLPAKAGTYVLRVEAKDASGQSLNTNPQTQARIVGVSFEGAEPVFLVGDAKRQEKITLRNIVRVDSDGGLPVAAQGGGQNLNLSMNSGALAAPQAKTPNFISFQKGVGSSNLDANQVSPEIREALARYQQQAPVADPAVRPAQSDEKGFPNGLHDDDGGSNNNAEQLAKGGESR